jgi:hypothetical protein
MPTDVRGRFLWHELLTTDPGAASRFYARVAGWSTQDWDQNPSYRLLAAAGVPMAGLLTLSPDARAKGESAHWLAYVGVPDVDAAVRHATTKGATVRSAALDVPTIGRMAELADPQGAAFAVYAPTREPEGPDEPVRGDFSWHELATTSGPAAWAFYADLFGWEFDSSFDMGPAGTYLMFRRAGGAQPIGGIYTRPPEMSGPVSWLPYVLVADADQAAAEAGRAGGTVTTGPMEVPGGDRVAVCVDPQGAGIGVRALKVAAPRTRSRAKPRPARKTAAKGRRKAPRRAKKQPAGGKKLGKRAAGKASRRAKKRPARRTRRPRR